MVASCIRGKISFGCRVTHWLQSEQHLVRLGIQLPTIGMMHFVYGVALESATLGNRRLEELLSQS